MSQHRGPVGGGGVGTELSICHGWNYAAALHIATRRHIACCAGASTAKHAASSSTSQAAAYLKRFRFSTTPYLLNTASSSSLVTVGGTLAKKNSLAPSL